MAHSSSRRPHPILKRDLSPFRSPTLPFAASRGPGPLFSPHVHFPPTPGMAATYPAYSPTTYDRKPIMVSPNVVQIPRRGSRKLHSPSAEEPRLHQHGADGAPERRGRTRTRTRSDSSSDAAGQVKGSYFHPRAYEACMPEPPLPTPRAAVPPLVQDLSPSDDSDGPVVTPPGGGALSAAHATSIAHAMELHLPEGAKPRQSQKPRRASVTLPRSSSERQLRKPELAARDERRPRVGRLNSWSDSFAANLDEGCLGGF